MSLIQKVHIPVRSNVNTNYSSLTRKGLRETQEKTTIVSIKAELSFILDGTHSC